MDDILFFKVWRNKYINFEIFKHIRLFNNNLHVQEFTIETLECYKYKEYLKSIIISDCVEDEKISKLNKLLVSLPNIKSLESQKDFNRELPPQEFTKLEAVAFGEHFNSGFVCCTLPVVSIAENLTCLQFGDDFNQPVDLVLLKNLKKLSFGSNFNKKIKPGQLPQSLKYIKFGAHFNQDLEANVLPKELDTLIFGTCFVKKVFQKSSSSSSGNGSGILSKVLSKTLCRKSAYNNKDEVNLKSLEWGDYFVSLKNIRLPSTLEYLKFGSNYNERSFTTTPSISKFRQLKTLIFGNLYNQQINYLPPSLVSLELSFHFNSIIKPEAIPSTLETIQFGYMYNRNLSFLKKSNVKTIILSVSFNQPLYTTLDNYGDYQIINQKKKLKEKESLGLNEIKSDLPLSLTHLDLSLATRFDQEFGNTILHTNLITLKLHKNYKKLIDINQLPKSLNDLQCHLHLNFHYFLKHSILLSSASSSSSTSSPNLNIPSPSTSPPNVFDSLSSSISSNYSTSSTISTIAATSTLFDSQTFNNCNNNNNNNNNNTTSPPLSPKSSLEIQQMISTSSLLPISKIIFDKSFRQCIPPNSIKSDYLKTIDFRFLYTSSILKQGSIPEGVENVAFNIVNIKLLKGILPSSVKNLYLSSYDPNPIIDSDTLPNTIEKIFIRHSDKPIQFKSIYSIPSRLENIYCFNTNKLFIQYCLNHRFLYSYLKIIDYQSNKNQII